MTFEEFKELALNPPRRKEETIFEVIEYDIKDLPKKNRKQYPKLNVTHFRVAICHTLEEAEIIVHKAIEVAKKYSSEIYCFHIKEYPVGEATDTPLSIEWYWDLRERIKSREGLIGEYCQNKELTDEEIEEVYFPDSGDDQIPVIDGPSYATHDHVHILNTMPLHYPLSIKMRQRFEGYYKAMLKEEERCNK